MPQVCLTLLGSLGARLDSGERIALTGQKAQALLAYLALRPGLSHTREKLAALLWPDVLADHARHSLRQALLDLRRILPADYPSLLVEERDRVALDPAGVEVDVVRFESLGGGDAAAAAQAAALYRGDLLEGLAPQAEPFEEWLLIERERLRELATEVLAKLLAHQVDAGQVDEAIRSGLQLLALDPTQESVHRVLMRLYARTGRRGAALRQYQTCVRVLECELGIEPERETREVYEEILQRRLPAPEREPAAGVRRSARARRSTTQRAGSVAAKGPLVGRQSELARLSEVTATARRGHAQLAVVTGEAGIGKTRLIEELAALAEARGDQVLTGRAFESQQILPFGAWVSALRGGSGTAVADVFADLEPAWRKELARLFPELGESSLGPPSGPEDYLRLFEGVGEVIRRLTSRAPLLVILEDVHWADEISLRVLAFLLQRLRDTRVALVATAREEELTDTPIQMLLTSEQAREAQVTHLSLGSLSREETVALVRGLTRADIDAAALARVQQHVWTLSEGNPFIAVETVRSLQSGELPPDSASLALPARVRDLIAERLERLPAAARELTGVAAVIGRAFDLGLLARAAASDEREIVERVETLVRRRVLEAAGEQFDFTHDRVREVAYETLLPPRRLALHGAVARALVSLHEGNPDDVVDQLAHHYLLAGDIEKAIEALTRVAEKAAWVYVYDESLQALERAAEYCDRLPAGARDRRRLEILFRQLESIFAFGVPQRGLELLLHHRDRAERVRDARLVGRYYFWLAHYHLGVEDWEQAAEHARRALEEARQAKDEGTQGLAHYVLSFSGYWWGTPVDGVEHARLGLPLLERRDEPRIWRAMMYFSLGINNGLMGAFEPALDALGRAESLAATLHHQMLRSSAAGSIGQLHAQRAEWTEALSACHRTLEAMTVPPARATALGFLGYVHVEKGEPDQAISPLEESLAIFGESGFTMLRGWYSGWLAEAYRLAGEMDRAREFAARGLARTTERKYWYAAGYAQRVLGLIGRDVGALAEANARLNEALATFQSIHARYFVARTRLDLGALAIDRGERAAAVSHLSEARSIFAALNVPVYIDRAERMASVLGLDFAGGVAL